MTRSAIHSILVASDLGPASDKVVGGAAALAGGLGAELHLLHVLDLSVLPRAEGASSAPSFPERIRQAEDALAEQVRTVAPNARPSSLRVMNQAVHEAILDRAEEVSASLIAVGPHRGGGIGAHVLGTTADRVIRAAKVPCLIASSPLSLPVRRIGVPTDFSEPSRDALDAALSLSIGSAPEIHVFHVGWNVEREDDPGIEKEKLGPALQTEVSHAVSRLGQPLASTIQTEVLWGVSPAAMIVQYAEQAELDLLVLGTHGYAGLKRFLIGSVASGVARQAPCPVLLVPPPSSQ